MCEYCKEVVLFPDSLAVCHEEYVSLGIKNANGVKPRGKIKTLKYVGAPGTGLRERILPSPSVM